MPKNVTCFLFVCFALCFEFQVFGQAPIIENQKCFGWTESKGDEGVKTILSVDGNLLVLGKKSLFDRETYWLAKTTLQGSIIWETCIFNQDFTSNYKPADIIQNAQGEIYITGSSMGIHSLVYSGYQGNVYKTVNQKGYFDIFLCKLNPQGLPLWEKVIGGSGADFPKRIIQHDGNKLMLFGYTNSSDGDLAGTNKNTATYNNDIFVVSMDTSGIILQKKCFGGNGEDLLSDAKKNIDGSYSLIGSTTSNDINVWPNRGDKDVYFLKITPELALINYKTFGGSKSDEGSNIVVEDSGNLVLGINSNSVDFDFTIPTNPVFTNNDKSNIWLLRLDSTNQTLLIKYYGGSEVDRLNHATRLVDGSIAIVGKTYSTNGDINDRNRIPLNINYTADVLVMKFSQTLDVAWERTIGGSKEDEAFHLYELGDNNYYLSCTTQSTDGDVVGNHINNNENKDFWLVNLFSPCVPILNLNQILSQSDSKFPAKNTINSVDKILNHSKVVYQSGKVINLMPGFKADSGVVMKTNIANCLDTTTAVSNVPIQVKINYECREGGMKFVYRPFTPDSILTSFNVAVENLDPQIPFSFTSNKLIAHNNSPLNPYNAYYLLTVSRLGHKDFNYQGYTSTCEHDGNPLNCPENLHDLILDKQYYAVGDTITATWTGGIGGNTGMNWFNDNVNTITANTSFFKGTVIGFPVKLQAQPSYPDYPKPCHGGVIVILKK